MINNALIASTALFALLALQQPADAQNNAPTCEQLRSSSTHQSRPDVVRMAFPDAIYVGQGRDAEALVRRGQLPCGLAALDHNGNVVYRSP